MVLIDTNIILRCVLNDHAELSLKAKEIVLTNEVLVLTRVIAECIYVMEKIYKSTKQEIADILLAFFSLKNVTLEHGEIAVTAVAEYGKLSLDFVDVLLLSYQKHTKKLVATFDKKLFTKLEQLNGNVRI